MNLLWVGGCGSCNVAIKLENPQTDCVMDGGPSAVSIIDRLGGATVSP